MSLTIRTITAGVPLASADDPSRVEAAASFLAGARQGFEAAGYEVQSLRAATQPLAEYASDRAAEETTAAILALDGLAVEHDLSLSIGPAIAGDERDERFAAWAADIVRRTVRISLSVTVASSDLGVHRRSVRAAASAITAIADAALAVQHGKPLAARLLPIPGAVAGDAVRIDNPHLTEGVVMDPAS